MTNNSATGGYLLPTGTNPYPSTLTFLQFMNTVMAGISGLPSALVRPRWQPNPPVQPDIDTDWLAFGVLDPLVTTNIDRLESVELDRLAHWSYSGISIPTDLLPPLVDQKTSDRTLVCNCK